MPYEVSDISCAYVQVIVKRGRRTESVFFIEAIYEYLSVDFNSLGKQPVVFLEDEGFEPSVFSTAKDFLSAIDTCLPDIFVLDVLHPDGDGIEICKELKSGERYSHIPVQAAPVLTSAGERPGVR